MAFEAFSDQSDQAEETVAVAGAEERPHRLMATCLQGRWLSHSEDLCRRSGNLVFLNVPPSGAFRSFQSVKMKVRKNAGIIYIS